MVAIAALLTIAVAIARNNAILKWLTVLCAIVLNGCLLVGLFQARIYSEFLREIRFGGGVPVSVQYKVDEKTTELDSGMLQILTSQTVFMKNDNGDFVEIPRERVIKIIYPSRKVTEGTGTDH